MIDLLYKQENEIQSPLLSGLMNFILSCYITFKVCDTSLHYSSIAHLPLPFRFIAIFTRL